MRPFVSRIVLFAVALLLAGCHRVPTPTTSGPLPQRGYLWQRSWTPAVTDAFREADQRTDGVIVLGAEILWDDNTPRAVRANLDWAALATANKPCAVGLRIASYPGPFATGDAQATAIAAEAKSLLSEAQSHGVTVSELQIDFDCAQEKLAGYAAWLQTLKRAAAPTRIVITTLPAWLQRSDFAPLVRSVDGYVLQVHSVPVVSRGETPALFAPASARKWVEQAARIGIPFSVALPTYRCEAGYDSAGKLLGVAMDSVDPSWPPGTRTLELAANADEIAKVVREWKAARPACLRELIWYRLPVATDLRNWKWPTLAAVMAGRNPAHRLEARHTGGEPVDFSIVNTGEAEEQLDGKISVQWTGTGLVACDALPGWTITPGEGKAVFDPQPGNPFRLLPGEKVDIGWIRFEKTPALEIGISSPASP